MEKYSKGQAEAISGIIIGAVLLFVGLFMVASVSDALPASQVHEFVYTTATNATDLTLNGSINSTNSIYVTDIATITGLTADKTLVITYDNENATKSWNISVWLNGNALATIRTTNNTAGTATYTDVAWVVGRNNLTFQTDNALEEVFINNTAGTYPSSTTSNEFGTMQTSLISTMGTIFSVLGLVLIVVALAMAIGALKGSMIGGGQPVA
jgi:hypothetical protein